MSASSKQSSVNTAKVQGRRTLRWETLDELKQDIDLILEADHQGQLESMGNWTPSQIFNHLAAWIEYGYVGYPMGAPPFFLRWLLKRMGKRYLEKGMPSGIRIPGVKQGTYGVEDTPLQEAHQRLTLAINRLQVGEECPYDSPAFGKMSHPDRVRLNLRHAELHLSFLRYPS
jgi:hypothetical protein